MQIQVKKTLSKQETRNIVKVRKILYTLIYRHEHVLKRITLWHFGVDIGY